MNPAELARLQEHYRRLPDAKIGELYAQGPAAFASKEDWNALEKEFKGRPVSPAPVSDPPLSAPVPEARKIYGLPVFILVLLMYVARESSLTIAELLLWPLLGGGCLILWLLFLHVLVAGDSLESLGLLKDRAWLDLLWGGAGSLVLLAMKLGFQATLAKLFPVPLPADEIVELLSGLSRNPWLLALWLGPVVWIGIAGFEELWRAFMLRRLWRVWGGGAGRWLSHLIVSALFGLAHLYQGPAAVVEIGLISVPMGWVFMARLSRPEFRGYQ